MPGLQGVVPCLVQKYRSHSDRVNHRKNGNESKYDTSTQLIHLYTPFVFIGSGQKRDEESREGNDQRNVLDAIPATLVQQIDGPDTSKIKYDRYVRNGSDPQDFRRSWSGNAHRMSSSLTPRQYLRWLITWSTHVDFP